MLRARDMVDQRTALKPFSVAISGTTDTKILSANYDRVALILSSSLGNYIVYNLGGTTVSAANGIILNTGVAPVKLLREEMGEGIGEELWAFAGANLTVQGWEVFLTGPREG